MKAKKNPSKDLNQNSTLYFVLGLTLILGLVYGALEWRTETKSNGVIAQGDIDEPLTEAVPLTVHKLPPPPPPPIDPPIIHVLPNEYDGPETEIIEPLPLENPIAVDSVHYIEPDPDLVIPIGLVEEVPIFPGCEDATDQHACFNTMMQKHIKKNFRYPEIAQELDIQGRVHIKFEIQKDGSIGNLKLRGPDKSLEKEAARIINKLPQMTPGKQGGRNVRVPYSIPITFKLN